MSSSFGITPAGALKEVGFSVLAPLPGGRPVPLVVLCGVRLSEDGCVELGGRACYQPCELFKISLLRVQKGFTDLSLPINILHYHCARLRLEDRVVR